MNVLMKSARTVAALTNDYICKHFKRKYIIEHISNLAFILIKDNTKPIF